MWLLWAPICHCKSLCAAPSLSPPSCRQPAPDWVHTWAPSAELLGLSSLRLSWRAAWIRPAAGLGTRPNTGRALPSSPRAPWNGRRACWLCKALGPGTPRTARLGGARPGTVAPPARAARASCWGWSPHSRWACRGLESWGGVRGTCLVVSRAVKEAREAATPQGMMCVRSRSVPGGHRRGHTRKPPGRADQGRSQTPHGGLSHPPAPATRGHGDGRRLGLSRLGASSSGWSLGDANTRQHTRRPTQQTVPGGIPL